MPHPRFWVTACQVQALLRVVGLPIRAFYGGRFRSYIRTQLEEDRFRGAITIA